LRSPGRRAHPPASRPPVPSIAASEKAPAVAEGPVVACAHVRPAGAAECETGVAKGVLDAGWSATASGLDPHGPRDVLDPFDVRFNVYHIVVEWLSSLLNSINSRHSRLAILKHKVPLHSETP
jgi:hypothetical protein